MFFCSGDGGEDGDSNAGDQEPPEPSELIEALQELENSASSDAVVRYGLSREPLLPGNTCNKGNIPFGGLGQLIRQNGETGKRKKRGIDSSYEELYVLSKGLDASPGVKNNFVGASKAALQIRIRII